MKIIPLKEGNFIASRTKDFSLLSDEKTDISQGIKMSVQPFLIITENDYILLDAGLGWKDEKGKTVISQILERENVRVDQVTKVLVSHLHKDHTEGLIQRNNSGFEATYPNAKIYIQKREFDFAMENKGNPSFDFDTLEKVIRLPQIIWMHEDKGQLTAEITYEVMGGHTPFMQVFRITENGETVFYGSDNLPQESYLQYHLAFKSDFDGRKAMELRQEWEKEAERNHWKIVLYHDLDKAILEW